MFVATVTRPGCPAAEISSASCRSWRAFSRAALMPAFATIRTAHSAQMQIAAEESLIGDACQSVVPAGYLASLLGLDHLMHTVLPCTIRHHPPRVLVHDLYLAFADDVLHIAFVHARRGQRLVY